MVSTFLHDSDTGAWLYCHHVQVIGSTTHVQGVMGDEDVPMEEWMPVELAFDDDETGIEERTLEWVGDEMTGETR